MLLTDILEVIIPMVLCAQLKDAEDRNGFLTCAFASFNFDEASTWKRIETRAFDLLQVVNRTRKSE